MDSPPEKTLYKLNFEKKYSGRKGNMMFSD